MKIGLVVAIELDCLFTHYPDIHKLNSPRGFEVYQIGHKDIYVIRSGMGEIAAAAACQYLICTYGVDIIVNYGVVGGLKEEMKIAKVTVLDRIVHYRYDCSEFMDLQIGQVDGKDSIFLYPDSSLVEKALQLENSLVKATCLSGDKFVSTAEEKRSISMKFDGDVCDMESAGIFLTCEANGVPCLFLKAVSDGLQDGAASFYEQLQQVSLFCLKITDQIISGL